MLKGHLQTREWNRLPWPLADVPNRLQIGITWGAFEMTTDATLHPLRFEFH